MTTKQYLNLGTAIYSDSYSDGLMVCGINWGGTPNPNYNWNSDMLGESFFSDERFQKPIFKRSVVKRFKLLGHPLETSAGKEGPFERSIIYTNWLRNQSPDMEGVDHKDECIADPSSFDYHVELFKPKLIMFFSLAMLDALNSPECATRSRDFLGPIIKQSFWGSKGEILAGTEIFHRKDRVGVQHYEKVTIIALPHTNAHIQDDYIEAYRGVISPIIEKYKRDRGFSN